MISLLTNYFQSLQSRLTAFIIILTIFISVSSYNVYISQLEIKQSIQSNTQQRNFIADKKHSVQNELIESYQLLNTFLLDPRNQLIQEWMYTSLDNALNTTDEIVKTQWASSRENSQLFDSIYISLFNLKDEINYLTEIRKNSNKQFPSLNIASSEMRPNRIIFINSVAIAINETRRQTNTSEIQIYNQLVDIRYFWTQLLSNFRIYLANQFGAFDIEILKRQELAISQQYKNLSKLLNTFAEKNSDSLGFETEDAVTKMQVALDKWYQAFTKVKSIHNSPRWRVDLNILETKIQPLLDELSYLLGLFDDEIKKSENEDKQLVDQMIDNQMTLLFGISIILILITAILLYVIKVVVFNPIKNVTSAIKEEATGLSTRLLPQVNSSEAKDLVDAFNEMRKQIHIRQDHLTYQANHDSLTHLPNRKYFLEQLYKQLQAIQDTNKELTVLLIDLNGFKDINDTLGHHIGDHLLKDFGRRLQATLNNTDVIARLGGDEFAILLPETDKKTAIKCLQKILQCSEKKFTIEGINTYIGMSIGAAVYPQHGDDENILLKHADVAMYIAKKQKIPYAFYKSSDDSYTLNRLSIIHDIKSSINHNGLILHFQPKINLSNNRLASVEALLRWNHPDLGMVMPDEFIAIAEQSGFINQISYWVIEEALIMSLHWKQQGFDIQIAINLSVYNLFDTDFPDNIKSILNKYKLASGNLIFEITESAMMTNPQLAISNLNKLRSLGIQLSIDDYGTGFSSLSYLSQLSLNELKVDKSFILDMLNDERKSVIVQSTIEMAHNLGLKVVAEGVENIEVCRRLRVYKCDVIQGYLVSRPLPEDKFIEWLNSYQADIDQIIN